MRPRRRAAEPPAHVAALSEPARRHVGPGIAVAAVAGVVWWLASGQLLVRLIALMIAAYLVWAFASSA